jgi:hypothetical protein
VKTVTDGTEAVAIVVFGVAATVVVGEIVDGA